MNELTNEYMCKKIEAFVQDRWGHNKLYLFMKEDGICDISNMKVIDIRYNLDTLIKTHSDLGGNKHQYDVFTFVFELNNQIYNMNYIVAFEEVRHYKFVPQGNYEVKFHDDYTEVKLIKGKEDELLFSVWKTLVNPRISTDTFIKSQLSSLYQAAINERNNNATNPQIKPSKAV